ncbi:MAG: hypothetical protein H6Q72_3138 [Firmicutes bacterium]|nr:hypothetical protein [Bacillota bacterium]
MEKIVLAATHKKNIGSNANVVSKTGISWKKHDQVMKEAKELLCKADTTHPSIYDSLHCGKLARLIAYINSGSAAVVVWINCYSEHALG